MPNQKYLINSVQTAKTKNGKEYLRMQLFEPGGKSHKAVFWESRDLKSGQVIEAWVEESEFGGEAQLNVKACRVTDDDPGELFLPRTKQSVDGLYAELQAFVEEVKDEKLKALLSLVVADPRWKRAPAAKSMHHAFLGGLLEHTVNLCRLARAVHGLYPTFLNQDLLLTGAILHDLGKMDEMSSGVTIEYTPEGNLLGHVGIGLLRVDKLIDTLDFPPALRLTVLHIIASHHGNLNFGALKQPSIVEAQVFSNLDGIDANIGKMTALVEKAGPNKEWTDKADYGSPALWLGPVDKV
ncbi:MAG: 3'-5' exoribonuclease YhaM family protein [Candidatus Acidiferrales bacterium]